MRSGLQSRRAKRLVAAWQRRYFVLRGKVVGVLKSDSPTRAEACGGGDITDTVFCKMNCGPNSLLYFINQGTQRHFRNSLSAWTA